MGLDDLRQAALQQEDDPFDDPDSVVAKVDEGKLFGLTAVERMLLAIGVFGISLVVSILVLVVTESIAF